MKKFFLFGALFAGAAAKGQPLTVEKIMQDAKWIGTSPKEISWTYDNKAILFNWNPEKTLSDSTYSYEIKNRAVTKANYPHSQLNRAISNGTYNSARTKIAFIYKGDPYLLDIASGNIKRILQTQEEESGPVFIIHEEWLAFQSGKNLFTWNLADGITRQLIEFKKERPVVKKSTPQDQWLQQQQLNTSDVIKKRKEKREAGTAFLKSMKDADSIPVIYTGDNETGGLQISPDGRFITYNLYEEAANAKTAVVPNYITENGYSTIIGSRGKVGVPQAKNTFYVFDRQKDTAILVKMDSLPGLKDRPLFTKDYPAKFPDTGRSAREVFVSGVYWSNEGSNLVIDILSQDFKDRWLMRLDAAAGKLSLVDRQHDDAWVGGPGIGWISGPNAGWINEHSFYFQSEASGYTHLYSYDINTQTKKQLTQGNYEIQRATLSNDKKYFYLITNEEHPGKQSFYRISSDGGNKQKISSMTGGYEVSLSPDEKYIAYRYSYQNKPWELFVQENAPGKTPVAITDKAMSPEWKSYPWRDTKITTFNNRQGLPVYARIYEPAAGKKNKAAVIFVHGAGYLQNVSYSWSYYYHEFMFNNLLADKGYTVIDIDYQASAGYGRNWRTAIYRHMGGKDLNDEVDAARFLEKEYGIDSGRIGIYGGSYGGFMTLMALFTQPGVFKAGAALRPVTDWGHYEDGYTGAILNRPFNDSIAYQQSSPINFAAGLKDHLLICHGMVDVNVHYQDAVRLAQRLIELGKDNWEMAAYPMEDHSFTEPSSWTDEYKRILKLFDENLLR